MLRLRCCVGFPRAVLLIAFAAAAGQAAPVVHSLGNNLIYVRVHKLPADLPAKPEGKAPACVVDLRFVEADPDVATAFGAWLKFSAAPRSPVFVLVNAGTSAALLRTLQGRESTAGAVVIGPAFGQFSPDLAVRTSAEDERRAYDAFENGETIEALITDNPDKVRVDEASLARERGGEPEEAGRGAAAGRSPPVVDAAIQRAVHLHRSLVALKKI